MRRDQAQAAQGPTKKWATKPQRPVAPKSRSNVNIGWQSDLTRDFDMTTSIVNTNSHHCKLDSLGGQLIPAGEHPATLVGIVDLGRQRSRSDYATEGTRQVMFIFELHGPARSIDGSPLLLSATFDWSMEENSVLRRNIENWRGAHLRVADFGPEGFRIRNLLGKSGLVSVHHRVEAGKVHPGFASIRPMRSSLVTSPESEFVLVMLTREEFNASDFVKLPNALQSKICGTREYGELLGNLAASEMVTLGLLDQSDLQYGRCGCCR